MRVFRFVVWVLIFLCKCCCSCWSCWSKLFGVWKEFGWLCVRIIFDVVGLVVFGICVWWWCFYFLGVEVMIFLICWCLVLCGICLKDFWCWRIMFFFGSLCVMFMWWLICRLIGVRFWRCMCLRWIFLDWWRRRCEFKWWMGRFWRLVGRGRKRKCRREIFGIVLSVYVGCFCGVFDFWRILMLMKWKCRCLMVFWLW